MTKEQSVYHYTNKTQWSVMNRGNRGYNYYDPITGKPFKSAKIRGLWPRDPFVPSFIENFEREAYLPVSYALMEPEPSSWIEHGSAWLYLIQYLTDVHDSTTVLLKVNLLPTDRAFVVDAALLLRMNGQSKERQTELYQQRWETRIPLGEYDGASFSLPEVIIPTPIPLDRLQKVWEKDVDKVYRQAEKKCEEKVA